MKATSRNALMVEAGSWCGDAFLQQGQGSWSEFMRIWILLKNNKLDAAKVCWKEGDIQAGRLATIFGHLTLEQGVPGSLSFLLPLVSFIYLARTALPRLDYFSGPCTEMHFDVHDLGEVSTYISYVQCLQFTMH
ncbi:hypothetical protein CRENBAI_016817 [Crenichthys baileyi]|uniref:Uncharacterized protein n=1 Tax=Crenichthys baileyi TaxID=28760 RepID=A0AAV9REV4_9TELE